MEDELKKNDGDPVASELLAAIQSLGPITAFLSISSFGGLNGPRCRLNCAVPSLEELSAFSRWSTAENGTAETWDMMSGADQAAWIPDDPSAVIKADQRWAALDDPALYSENNASAHDHID